MANGTSSYGQWGYGGWTPPDSNYPGSTNFPSRGQPEWDKLKAWQPWQQSFQSPTGGVGPDPWFMSQGFIQSPSATYIDQFRGQLGESRGLQRQGLQELGAYARGEKSASREAMREAIERAEYRNRAAARSARTPAEARAALYNMAGAQQQAARGGATAAMQEQLGAQQAYLTAAGQMRTADVGEYQAGQMERLRQIQGEALIKDIGAKYMALGLSDKEAERRARIDYEKMKLAGYEGAAGRASAESMLQSQLDQQLLMSLIGGGSSAAGGLLAGLAASDERVKDINEYITASCAGQKNIYGETDDFVDELVKMEEPGYEGPSSLDTRGSTSDYLDTVQKTKSSGALETQPQGSGAMKGLGQGMQQAGQDIMREAMSQQDTLGMKMQRAANQRNEAAIMQMIDAIPGADEVASDERVKDIQDFMDNMRAINFTYKDPEKHGYGERTGVIAQDVEKSKLGSGMVVEDAEGVKHLDMNPQKFNPLVLASLANLNKRLNEVEAAPEQVYGRRTSVTGKDLIDATRAGYRVGLDKYQPTEPGPEADRLFKMVRSEEAADDTMRRWEDKRILESLNEPSMAARIVGREKDKEQGKRRLKRGK